MLPFDLAGSGEFTYVAEILEHLLRSSGYMKMLEEENSFESQGRLENLIELVSQAREFDAALDLSATRTFAASEETLGSDRFSTDAERETESKALKFRAEDEIVLDPTSAHDRVNAFLEAVSLLAESDQSKESEECVTLMTLHTAKGLEYPVVFITGLEEGLFPHERSMGDVLELEEERRLCYVGITRAMDQLFLSCALSRMMYATPDYFSPSRFLREIPAELVNPVKDTESSSEFMQSRSPNASSGGVHAIRKSMKTSLLTTSTPTIKIPFLVRYMVPRNHVLVLRPHRACAPRFGTIQIPASLLRTHLTARALLSEQ